MLTLDQLRVLRAIAHHRSIAEAARSLHLSQPTLSHHLLALEAIVGAPLVVRTPRGSHLTELGEIALEHAETLLDRVGAAEQELAEHRAYGTSVLEIGAFPSVGAALVAPALADLAAAGAPYRLTIAEPVDVEQMLRDHRLHVGLVYSQPDIPVRVDEGLRVEPLFDEPLVVVLPRGHPAARHQVVDLADLAGETWISGPTDEDAAHQLLLRAFRELGVEARVGARLDDFAVTEALVRAGHGVSLMPTLALPQLGDAVEPRVLSDPRFRRRVSTVWRAEPPRPVIDIFREAIRQRVQTMPEQFEQLAAARPDDR